MQLEITVKKYDIIKTKYPEDLLLDLWDINRHFLLPMI